MTLAVVGVFTYLFGRPIRAIDRSINELGRGTFSRPIAIRGPADWSGSQLSSSGCGCGFSISRKRRIDSCDTCRMN